MAKQLNVNLAFTADTSQAAAQVRSLQQSLTQLINQPVGIGEKLSQDMLKATHAAAELKMHLQNATNVDTGTLDFGKLNQSLKSSGVTLQQYATKLQSLGPQGQQAFMQLARSVANAEVPLRRSNALLAQFSTTLANTARWQLSSSMLHGFIGAVSSAWNYSKDLNESLNNIRIVTGYNIDQMSKFADQANRAAKALSTTTTEYTNASLIYYQQGLSDAEVLGRTETTIKMANASRQSAEIVSDQMTAIWNNFYDGSKSLEYYADVVTALGAATASSSEEIAQGLEKFAAVADTVGLSYEYATAALATVTATTRQSADVVGTAFKTLFARLSDLKLGETLEDGTTLGSYSENLAKIGVNIKDASGQLKDMDTILSETAAKWDNLDKAQQVALAKGVAGIRQYTQFIALMDNWDFMEENLNTATGSAGTLTKQAKIYEESWEAASKKVKASLETIYASIIDDEFFIDLTNGFAKLIDGVGGFIKSIGGLQGVLSGLGWILTKVFAEQMTQGFQNLYYNIQMSSEAGRKAIQDMKIGQMQSFADSMLNYETSTVTGKTAKSVYSEELVMQQQLAEKADQMTAAEQQKCKFLIEQHRVMGEQSMEIAKQLEMTKERISIDRENLMGTGLNNNRSMDTVVKALDRAKGRANAMAEVRDILKSVGTTAEISQEQIDNLSKKLGEAGVRKGDIAQLANALRGASGDGAAMGAAIEQVNGHLSEATLRTSQVIARILGVRQGTPEFERLASRVAQYMNNTQQATVQQNNLDNSLANGADMADRFGDAIDRAGKKTQTASQLLSTVVSGLMSFGMLVSSITGLVDTLEDPDTTGWEKFGRILTSVSMIAMSVMGTFAGMKAAYDLVTSGVIKNTLVITANSIAQYLNEKAQKKKAGVATLGNVVTNIGNKVTKQSSVENAKEAITNEANVKALRKENAEKMKAIALDKMRGKTVKGPTTGSSGQKFTAKSVDKGQPPPKLEAGTLKTLGGAAGSFLTVAAAAALVVGTIWVVSEAYNKEAKEAENAAKSVELLSQIHEETKQKYEDLKNTISDYDSAVEGLDKLTEGTVEFEEAITNANEKAMELISNYSELQGKYSIDNNGLIKFDEGALEDIQKKESEKVRKTASASQFMQRQADEKQREADILDFKRKKLRTYEDIGGSALGGLGGAATGAAAGAIIGSVVPVIGSAIGALSGAIIGAISGAVGIGVAGTSTDEEDEAMEKIYTLYKEQGNAIFAKGTFEKLLKQQGIESDLIEDLVKNTDEIKKYVSEKKAGEDADKATWISDYLRNNPDVANHANAEAIAAQAYEDSKKNKDTTVDNLGNADLMKAYLEEVLGETATKQGFGVGSAWISENYKIEDTGGAGYSFYKKGEDGKWVLQGDENAYAITDARETLRNTRTQKAAGEKSDDYIAKTEQLVNEYKAAGIKNNELINKLVSASVSGENASLTLDEYLSLQSQDLSKLSKEQQKSVKKSLDEYEKNKPDFFQDEKFKNWYNNLNKSEKQIYEAEIAVNVDKNTTLENLQASVANAQAWLDLNSFTTSIKINDEFKTFLGGMDRYDTINKDENGKTGQDKFFEYIAKSGIVENESYLKRDESGNIVGLTDKGQDYYKGMTTPEILRLIEQREQQTSENYLEASNNVIETASEAITAKQNENEQMRGNIDISNQKIDYFTNERDKGINPLSNTDQAIIQNFGASFGKNNPLYFGNLQMAAEEGQFDGMSEANGKILKGFGYYGNEAVTSGLSVDELKDLTADNIDEFAGLEEFINYTLAESGYEGYNFTDLATWAAEEGKSLPEYVAKFISSNAQYLPDQLSSDTLIKVLNGSYDDEAVLYDANIQAEKDKIEGYEQTIAINNSAIKTKQDEIKEQEIIQNAQAMDYMRNVENEQYGIDSTAFDETVLALQDMAEAGEQSLENLKENELQLTKIAQGNLRLETGIKSLYDNWDNWNNIIQEGNTLSSDYISTMDSLKKSMANILDIDPSDVDDTFILEHYDLIAEAAKGSTEAINKLKVEMSKDIVAEASLDYSKVENGQQGLEELMTQVASEELEIGATLDDSEFASALFKMLEMSGASVEDMQRIFNTLGWEPEVGSVKATGTVTADADGYVDLNGEKVYVGVGQTFTEGMEIPYIKTNGKGTPSFNFRGTTDLLAPKPKNNGGGGGSKKPAEKKKKTDIVDRYKEITDSLDDNTDAMEKASRAAERLYGKDRLSNMREANKLLQNEIELTKKKRKEAEAYLKEDGDALATAAAEVGIEFTFDDKGNITNYTEQMTLLYDQLDTAITKANEDGFASESEQKEIDNIQKKIDNVKNALKTYEDTRETIEDLDKELEEKFNEWQDKNFEILNAELEIKIELNDMELEKIEYYLSKIEDDFYSMAEAASLITFDENGSLGGQMEVYLDNLEAQKEYVKELERSFAAGEISEAAYVEGLKNANRAIYENLGNIQALDKEMQEYYSNTLTAASEELSKYTELMEHSASVLDHYKSIAEMLGKSTDYKYMDKILRGQSEVAKQSYEVSKANYEMLKRQEADRKADYDAAVARGAGEKELEGLKKNWEAAQKSANEAQDQMLSDAEAWGKALRAILDNELSSLGQDLENSLTGAFGSFDAMDAAFKRRNSLQEEYLTTTNKVYETNKLMRTAQKEIDKTTNQMAKTKLKQFINETSALQQQGRLSQYELDIQQAKYDLLLAEIALREAQNAKSTVRLRRDSEGNFGYVYTADQNAIADAQQKFEDAENALYNKALEGANNYVQKYQETMAEMQDTLTQMHQDYLDGAYESEEEYNRAVEEAKAYYYQKLTDYSELYQVAVDADAQAANEAWSRGFAAITENTEYYMGEVSKYIGGAKGAIDEWKAAMDIINQETLGNMEQAVQDVVKASQDLAKTAKEEVIPELESELTAVDNVTTAYMAYRDSLDQVIGKYETLVEDSQALIVKLSEMEAQAKKTATAINTAYTASPSSTSNDGGNGGDDDDRGGPPPPSTTAKVTLYASPGGGRMGEYTLTKGQFKISEHLGYASSFYNYKITENKNGPSSGYVSNSDREKLIKLDTGGYTGEWGPYGKMAMLHEKELILNKHDTENFLASMEILHRILEIIDLQSMSSQIGGILSSPAFNGMSNSTIEQNVHIEASFPNATNHSEIEEAFNNLINTASQYANRK